MSATQNTFIPQSEMIELTEVYDVKGWMSDVTPALHDHLKAHHFKFMWVAQGSTRMFYKKWSTDETWLPANGICLLEGAQQSGFLPLEGYPTRVTPSLATDDLQKLTTTVSKMAGYLEKSGGRNG